MPAAPYHDITDRLMLMLVRKTLAPDVVDDARREIERLRHKVIRLESYLKDHRRRIHLPECFEGHGCNCGLAKLPIWFDQQESTR